MGELSRMTQYKSKKLEAEEKGGHIGAGIFNYPSLTNADILMYDPDYVPVGEDQKQHVELARNVAERFNSRYSDTFKLPEPIIPKVGGRIMDLQDPTKKMSKSDENVNGFILLEDDPDTIRRKIKKCVTDSEGVVRYSPEQPGIKNLLDIYSALSGKSIDEIVKMYEGKGYGDFKADTAEVIISVLEPMRQKYLALLEDKEYLEKIYCEGAKKAEAKARKTLRKVYKKVGFLERKY